jgi:O-antigen/teichoic acid export membrane protein
MTEIINISVKKAVKGTSLILSGTAVSALLLLTIKILIVRNTTKEELGVYTLSIAVANIFALLATLGIHEGIARYVALLLGRNELYEANSLSQTAIRIVLISGICGAVLLYSSADFLAQHAFHNLELSRPLKCVSLSIPFFVILQVIVAILRGHGVITSKIYFMDVGIPLIFSILLCGVLFWQLPFLSILYAYVLAIILACKSIISYGYRKIGINLFQLKTVSRGDDLLKFSLPLLIGMIMVVVMNWTDTLMLGRYVGAKTVGTYDVSVSLAKLLYLPLAALEFVFLPIAGTLFSQEQFSELKRTYQVLTKLIFLVTAPIFFMLFLFPETVISIFFGSRFFDAVVPLRILALGFLIHAAMGPNGILMVVVGMSKELTIANTTGVVLNILLNYLLIKRFAYGIIGASMASVGTYLVLNAIASIVIYKKNDIHPFTGQYLKAICAITVTGLILYFISMLLTINYWILPVYFILFISGGIAILFLTGSIGLEDVSLLEAALETSGLKVSWFKKRFKQKAGII